MNSYAARMALQNDIIVTYVNGDYGDFNAAVTFADEQVSAMGDEEIVEWLDHILNGNLILDICHIHNNLSIGLFS